MTRRRRILLAVAAVVFLAGAAGGVTAFWLETGRHLVHPKNWGVVVPDHVWRSGQIHPRLVEDVLREHEIEVIVDLTLDTETEEAAVHERAVARELDIRKVDLVSLDGRGVGDPLDYVVALQEMARARDEGTRLLIHCAGGSERTGGIVASYRMLYEGWDGQKAWAEYLSFRKHPPETDALVDFVNEHLPEIARRLVASGDLERAPARLPRFGPRSGDETP